MLTQRFKWPTPDDANRLRNGASDTRALGAAIDAAPVLGNEWVVLPTVGTTTIVSGSWSAVLFDLAALTCSTVRDALAAVDTAGVNVPTNKPGLYLVAFTVSWAATGSGGRRIIGPAAGQNIAPATTYQQMTTSTAAVAITHSGAWLWSQG